MKLMQLIVPAVMVLLIAQPALAQGDEGSGRPATVRGNDLIVAKEKSIAVDVSAEVEELREMRNERVTELEQEAQAVRAPELREVWRNQNKVRAAVHTMLAMRDLEGFEGGIGEEVSEIAREFDNSVQSTLMAEERIRTRNPVWAFFFGGDSEAAEEIEQRVEENRERIERLRRARESCDCAPDVAEMLREQEAEVEAEQARLAQVSAQEKANRGIFGWILG